MPKDVSRCFAGARRSCEPPRARLGGLRERRRAGLKLRAWSRERAFRAVRHVQIDRMIVLSSVHDLRTPYSSSRSGRYPRPKRWQWCSDTPYIRKAITKLRSRQVALRLRVPRRQGVRPNGEFEGQREQRAEEARAPVGQDGCRTRAMGDRAGASAMLRMSGCAEKTSTAVTRHK